MLIKRIYFFMVINFFYLAAYANTPTRQHNLRGYTGTFAKKEENIGDIASNLFNFGQNLSQVAKTVVIMAGISIIMFGMIQYGKHRNNPVETPISKVIMTIVVGLSLIALSFVPMHF